MWTSGEYILDGNERLIFNVGNLRACDVSVSDRLFSDKHPKAIFLILIMLMY